MLPTTSSPLVERGGVPAKFADIKSRHEQDHLWREQRLISHKEKEEPETLTDPEIALLALFREDQVYEEQRLVRLRKQAIEKKAIIERKASGAAVAPATLAIPRKGEDYKAFKKRCARLPVPFALVDSVLEIIKENKKQTADLEAENRLLKARTRTLEEIVFSTEIRVDAVKASIDRMELAGSLQYAGVWEAGKVYPKGTMATHGGSVWIAKGTTTAKPGDEPGDVRSWQLAVKKGQRGREQ